MNPGTTMIPRNAKIDMFIKGTMRLAVDKWGRVEVTEPASFEVKEVKSGKSSLEQISRVYGNQWTRETKFPHGVWAAGRGLIALLLPNIDVVDNIWLKPLSWEGQK